MRYFREKETPIEEVKAGLKENWKPYLEKYKKRDDLALVLSDMGYAYFFSVYKKCNDCGKYKIVELTEPEREFRFDLLKYKIQYGIQDDRDFGPFDTALKEFEKILEIELKKIDEIEKCKCAEEKYNEIEERNKVKEQIKKYIEETGKPQAAYYYDGGQLTLEYIDNETGLGILSNKTFDYWGKRGLYGNRVFMEEYEKLLRELNINIPVLSLQDREESEGIDAIEDYLFEYCLGNKELIDKFYKMTNAEKKAWYDEIVEEEW